MTNAYLLLVTILLIPTTSISAQDTNQSVVTTMCQICTDGPADTVADGCQTYTTPLDRCYNAQTLFPHDPSWSTFDIIDTISMKSMKRTFYKSKDGSCSNPVKVQEDSAVDKSAYYTNLMDQNNDDYFILPFDECVGPFGEPRPWGKFTLVQDIVVADE